MNLMQYVTKAKKAISGAYWELEAAIMAKNKAVERVREKAARDKTYTNIEANEDTDRANTEFDTAYSELQNKCREALDTIRGEFTEVVHELYALDGAKISDADQRLLNSGIELTREEVCKMVIRNAENVTMLRLINTYIAKWGISELPTSIEKPLYRATQAGALEVKAFDEFVHLASMGLGHIDGNYVYVQRRLDEYEADAQTALEKAKPYISPDELKAVEAVELTRKNNFQPLTK